MANNAFIDILAHNKTKEGWEDAIKTAVNSSKKIEDSVEDAGSGAAGVADKIGHTGEVASKMAINLLQAFGLSGEKAKALEGILRQIDDGFDALGKAAQLATVANTAMAASNVAVGTTATGATTAVGALTAAMIANPITATLVAIAAAAGAVYVAFQMFKETEVDVKDLNLELENQKFLLDAILGSLKERTSIINTLAKIEAEMAQKQEVATIKGIQNVETAREQLEITSKLNDELLKQSNTLEEQIEFQVRNVEILKKKFSEQQAGVGMDLTLGIRLTDAQETLNASLDKSAQLKKQISNLEEQSRAAAERALEIPKEEEKIKEENDKKQLKREEELAKKRAKFAADRLEAEELYADAVSEMGEERKKADDEREKAWKEEHEHFKKEIENAEKLEKFAPKFVGLEDLTRGIQLSALGATAKDRKDEESRQAQIESRDLLKAAMKVWGDTARFDEETATHSKEMAEKIDKLGALA